MRILQVIHDFLPSFVGGSEIYTYELSKELSKRHDVFVFCKDIGFAGKEFFETEEFFKGLMVKRVYHNPRRINFFQTYRNARIEESFEKYLEEIKPDLVHFQHTIGLSAALPLIAKRMDIPVVLTLHDFWYMCPRTQLLKTSMDLCRGPRKGMECIDCMPGNSFLLKSSKAFFRKFKRFIPLLLNSRLFGNSSDFTSFFRRTGYMREMMSQADAIIATTEFQKDMYEKFGIPRQKMLLYEHGIDLSRFRNFSRKPSKELRFGYLSSIIHHKGLHVLIEAFNLVGDKAILKIYGSMEVRKEYAREVKEMARNERIKFCGDYAPEELAQILSELNVLVVPSLWYENAPLIIRYAQRVKMPVIASNVEGMSCLVKDGFNGFLFEMGNSKELYEKIKIFIDNPHLVKTYGKNMPPVKSIQENAREMEEIYERLTKVKM